MSTSIGRVVGATLVAVPLCIAQVGESAAQDLQSFAVVSGQSLTNTGPTTIVGNIAVSPGTSYTGAGSVSQNGAVFLGDAVAKRMQDELALLYTVLEGRPTSNGGNLTGQDLGGMTLAAGVYSFDSSAMISSGQTLTLDAGGNPDAIFIFNVGSSFVAESGSKVVLINQAQGGNVFYRVGSSATLNTTAQLEGQILALASVTMNTSAGITCGSANARTGSVTLDTNTIQICTLAGRGFGAVANAPHLNANQQSVARALSDFVAAGGVLPVSFAILAATQAPDELARSLAQLSGEVSTGIAPMGFQSMNAFLDSVTRSGRQPRGQALTPRDAGVPIGLVQEKIHSAYAGKYGTAASDPVAQPFAYSPALVGLARPWAVWASGYGTRSVTDGNAGLGQQERTSDNRGLAVGLNFSASARTDFGIALSMNKADFALANGFGSGSSDTMFVALRGRTSTDRAYLEGALAYGRSDITTNRTVTLAGVDRLRGDTKADAFAAHVEAGYHMGRVTPFAGLRAQSFTTQAYSETAVSGSPAYALRYAKHTTRSLRSELGVDMHWPTDHAGGARSSVGLRAAWAHEFVSNKPSVRSFVAVPGVAFPISGAARDKDSVILSVSGGVASPNGVFLDGAINAEYSRTYRDIGGSVTVGYRW